MGGFFFFAFTIALTRCPTLVPHLQKGNCLDSKHKMHKIRRHRWHQFLIKNVSLQLANTSFQQKSRINQKKILGIT